jgi:hypothetical protein
MKSPAKLLFAFAATCLAFVSSSRAQVLTNTDTYAGYNSSAITFGSFGGSLYQTFSNVSAVQSMTFNFFTTSSPAAASTFTATFGQWNGSSFVGGTTVSFGTINVPTTTDNTPILGPSAAQVNASGWTNNGPIGNFNGFSVQRMFDFTSLIDPLVSPTYGYTTSSSNTYAMMITQTSGPNTLALGANFTNPLQTSGVGFDGTTNLGTTDWVFSQMAVYAGNQNLTAVPESSTVAAIAGVVLVAGLVTMRMRQRRQLAAVPVAA